MYARTLLVTILIALGGTGAVLGAARSSAAPTPRAKASKVSPSHTSTPIETSRLSLCIEEWLAKLGVLPEPRASEVPAEIGATLQLHARSILDEASNLSGSISRWFSAHGAAPDLQELRQRVAGRQGPSR